MLKSCLALWKRDLLEQFSYQGALFLETLGILSNLLVFYFIAKLLPSGSSPFLASYEGGYFAYVLIGIAFSGFQLSALNAFTTAIQKEVDAGTFEAIFVTAAGLRPVLLASLAAQMGWTALRTSAYFLLGSLFFGAHFGRVDFPAAAITVFLTISSHLGLGLVSAGFVVAYKRGDPVAFFTNTASKFLSGVYFPVAVLPAGLQALAHGFPLTHSLEALRKVFMNHATLSSVSHELAALTLFTLILMPAGLIYFRWAFRKALREGSLAFQ